MSRVRERRRDEIVAAARAIVAKGGLEALTVAALEEKLGFTRGVLTYHFEDKDELVLEVLRSAVREIDAATREELKESRSLEDKVRVVLRTKVRGFLEHREAAWVLVSFWGRLHADRRVRKANAALYAAYRRQTAALFPGLEHPSADAAVMVGLVVGIVTQALFDPDAFDPDAATEEAIRMVLARLKGRDHGHPGS